MKKIFLIFAAMLLTLAVKADPIAVTPGNNKLKAAVKDAAAESVLELADGIYYEEGNFDMKKNLTIKAATGAHPIIANLYYFRVEDGADITFQGIIFDGALYNIGSKTGASDHCVRPYGAATGQEDVVFENCEFRNYPSHVLYTQRNTRKWKSLTVRNCYFHNNARHDIAIEYDGSSATSCDELTVENSTFVKVNGSDNAIFVRNGNTTSVSINKCTFYNNGSSFISAGASVEDVAVSNCIFANPSSKSHEPVALTDGTLSNCLSYNTGSYVTGENITNTACITGDPLFRAPAVSNFTLNYGSPAYEAGTAGSNIGDPRWLQEAHTVYCKMEYSWWADGASAIGAYAYTEGLSSGTIKNGEWPGVRMTAVAGQANMWEIELAPKFKNVIFTHVNAAGDISYKNHQTDNLEMPNSKFNLYTITSSSEASPVTGAWSMWPAPAATDIQLVGEMNGWNSNELFVVADGGLTASYKIHLDKNGDGYEFKILRGSDMLSINNGDTKYWFTRANNSTAVAYNDANSKPCLVNVDLAGDYTFTWTYATNTLTITYPAPLHENGYYLVGKFGAAGKKTDQWTINYCVAAKKLTVDPLDAGLYTITTKLIEADELKIVKVENDVITTHYPSGSDNNYVMTADQAGDSKVVNFRPAGDGPAGWHYNYIYVADNSATSIDNTVVGEKAVKFFENGQIFIQKDGKVYNILGTVVK